MKDKVKCFSTDRAARQALCGNFARATVVSLSKSGQSIFGGKMKATQLLALCLISLFAFSCSSNKHKAEKIETAMEREDTVTGDDKVGVKDGNLVVQRKVAMNEELRRLQYEVYELEDRVYGNRKYGSRGLYGTLKACREQLARKEFGGEGRLKWTEPMERITDKEDEYKIGIDEKNKLVAVTEEFLKDRITRFRGYKTVLMKREDEYQDKNESCKVELDSKRAEYEQKKKAEADKG
jgi:hypothetical protein